MSTGNRKNVDLADRTSAGHFDQPRWGRDPGDPRRHQFTTNYGDGAFPDRQEAPDAREPGAMTRQSETKELIRWNGPTPRPPPAQSRRTPARRCDA